MTGRRPRGAWILGEPDHDPRPDVHVIPTTENDDHHATSPDCWCRPLIEYTDLVTNGRVWVYRGLS